MVRFEIHRVTIMVITRYNGRYTCLYPVNQNVVSFLISSLLPEKQQTCKTKLFFENTFFHRVQFSNIPEVSVVFFCPANTSCSKRASRMKKKGCNVYSVLSL